MNQVEKLDCIILPGGGLNPDGSIPDWVLPRLERALELRDSTRWFLALSAGTTHKPPPLDGNGFPICESRSAAEWLVEAGIEPARVLVETSSYDTIGNAYFARVQFCEPLELKRCHAITSEFHLARVEKIFQWVFGLRPSPLNYALSFEGTPDSGLAPEALAARTEKEAAALARLAETQKGLDSLGDFTNWLYTEHRAYAAPAAAGLSSEPLPEDVLKSY